MLTRGNIILIKHEGPKRFELLDGWIFVARYNRVTRDHLPANIRMRRWYKQRAAPRNRHSRCPCEGGQRGQD